MSRCAALSSGRGRPCINPSPSRPDVLLRFPGQDFMGTNGSFPWHGTGSRCLRGQRSPISPAAMSPLTPLRASCPASPRRFPALHSRCHRVKRAFGSLSSCRQLHSRGWSWEPGVRNLDKPETISQIPRRFGFVISAPAALNWHCSAGVVSAGSCAGVLSETEEVLGGFIAAGASPNVAASTGSVAGPGSARPPSPGSPACAAPSDPCSGTPESIRGREDELSQVFFNSEGVWMGRGASNAVGWQQEGGGGTLLWPQPQWQPRAATVL